MGMLPHIARSIRIERYQFNAVVKCLLIYGEPIKRVAELLQIVIRNVNFTERASKTIKEHRIVSFGERFSIS